jgi:hypothetical protein
MLLSCVNGRRLRMHGNRMLRKTFGAKRVEETGGLRKSHNEYLHDLCPLPNWILFECLNEEM